MPGPAPKPPSQRARRNTPKSGEWVPAPGMGWQHGDPEAKVGSKAREAGIPQPPADLRPSSVEVWQAWFAGWWASHWEVEHLPHLRDLIRLYDKANLENVTEFKNVMAEVARFGITPDGALKLHWLPPEKDVDEKPAASDELQEKRAERAKRVS